MMITHEEISKRARDIWEREGRPEGRDMEHWLQAEAELRGESAKDQNGSNLTVASDEMLRVPNGLHSEQIGREDSARKRTARRAK